MKVRFFDFSQYHNRHPVVGSTHIRVRQLLKYWPEAANYKYGESPDVLIFQKVYVGQDYKFPVHFRGLKILDICDPDWFNGKTAIVETINAMDAVVCPTEAMAGVLRQFTDKPVRVIKDRFDLELVPKPRRHTKPATTVAWFGYRHNIQTMKPALPLIDELGLRLLVLSEDDPIAYQWEKDIKDRYIFVKYAEATFYEDLSKADFVVFPKGLRPQDAFKSNNKAVKAMLAGLPVATDEDSLRRLMDPVERQHEIDTNYDKIVSEYDVRNSVTEYQQLIGELLEGV